MKHELEDELGWKIVFDGNGVIGKYLDFTPEIEYSVGSEEKESICYSPKQVDRDYFSYPESQKAECERWLKRQRADFPDSEFAHPSYVPLRQEYYPNFHTDWNVLHDAIDKIKDRGTIITISDKETTWKAVFQYCKLNKAEEEK